MPALRRPPLRRISAPMTLALETGDKVVDVRIDRRARQLLLKVNPNGDLELVLPPYVSRRAGLEFLEERRLWISQQLRRIPQPIPLAIGIEIPILGTPHRIVQKDACGRGAAWFETSADQGLPLLCVTGKPEHITRRLTDFLKAEARRRLIPMAERHAQKLSMPLKRIRFAETRRQWGSCTAAGDLSFSWRLILAPEWIADYVVAHEVAHLRELNHSPRFWHLVAQLIGDRRTVTAARLWLRRQGDHLHQYG